MIIRRNTKAFKTILQLVTECQDRPDREKLIRLYITKAGHSIRDRISIEGIEGGAELFYEMSFQTVLNNLKSSNHQLNVSDEIPGIYFFHSASNKVWDESPFEFDESIKEKFGSLPEPPLLRKKGESQKFVLPVPAKKIQPPAKKGKVATGKPVKIADSGPKQPDYKLKHKIDFTNLNKVIFRQSKLDKQGVLDYFNEIADYLLPYLKDRPQWTRLYTEGSRAPVEMNKEIIFADGEEPIPGWVQASSPSKGKSEQTLLCNSKEHLLLYVERGCLQFSTGHARIKQLDAPDYMLIAIDFADSELEQAIDVALTANEILTGLQLPSFIKTDGVSAFHVYIPLDSKSDFETSRSAVEYICKLIGLKIPDQIVLKGSDEKVYGKVSLDASLNDRGKHVVAPYSLVPGLSAVVASPLLWEEVNEHLRFEAFNHETIFNRLKQIGDPLEGLFQKKVNAEALLKRLEEHYSFLF